jgi:purine-nucleoside phosphorylase
MTIHIGARPGDIAPTILMPGDPFRARWAAERFLQAPRLVNEVRGMLGYTGTWNGHPVTIQASGMGMPSMSIYANELIRDYGAQVLIRIGSAGAMQPQVKLRDIVLAVAATTVGSPSRTILRDLNFAPTADFGLLRTAWDLAQRRGLPVHAGGVFTSDTFYDERPDLTEQLSRHGVLCVEMETAELYTLAARHGRRALSILTMSDHLLTQEAMTAAERETGFAAMVDLALGTVFAPGAEG